MARVSTATKALRRQQHYQPQRPYVPIACKPLPPGAAGSGRRLGSRHSADPGAAALAQGLLSPPSPSPSASQARRVPYRPRSLHVPVPVGQRAGERNRQGFLATLDVALVVAASQRAAKCPYKAQLRAQMLQRLVRLGKVPEVLLGDDAFAAAHAYNSPASTKASRPIVPAALDAMIPPVCAIDRLFANVVDVSSALGAGFLGSVEDLSRPVLSEGRGNDGAETDPLIDPFLFLDNAFAGLDSLVLPVSGCDERGPGTASVANTLGLGDVYPFQHADKVYAFQHTDDIPAFQHTNDIHAFQHTSDIHAFQQAEDDPVLGDCLPTMSGAGSHDGYCFLLFDDGPFAAYGLGQ